MRDDVGLVKINDEFVEYEVVIKPKVKPKVEIRGGVRVVIPHQRYEQKVLEAALPWLEEKYASFKNLKIADDDAYLFGKCVPRNEQYFKTAPKQVREKAEKLLFAFSEKYKVRTLPLSIRNQKTKWGSCSPLRISLNVRMAVLPERLFAYVVFHEFAHIQHKNHQKPFWNFVSKEFPDYKQLRKELRLWWQRACQIFE